MLGVCWYPEHWPEGWWAEDAAAMREMGITFVRIAEFAWSRIEPAPGRFDWGWLDLAVEVLEAAGLKIVMCTPTATPPRWLVDELPEMLGVDAEGRARRFGSRRHYSYSSAAYAAEAARITEAVTERYGRHPAVAGWQTDNEHGCHDTVLSWDESAKAGFQDWLRRRYQDPQRLNEAWGNVFWSMEVSEWREVELPVLAVTEANPAARLDFWRYSSDRVAEFDRRQVEIIRARSPGRFVTHNFMGLFHDFDHRAVAAHLDLASWDSYPLGHTERMGMSDAEHVRWAETGHPDIAGFHHDLYRGLGRGRFWVMEQQPGPVNWARWNPVPKPGMVRLWTWEALAHGAECVSYFRWRQCAFAQEQMHAGLHRPDRSRSAGGEETATVARELKGLELPATGPAPVALVVDDEASWYLRIQPQGEDFDYVELTFLWYGAMRRLGLDVDVVRPGDALGGYRAVVVPTLPYLSDAAMAAFAAYDGPILFGPRTGSKTRTFAVPDGLPPGPLQELMPLRVTQAASLRPGLLHPIEGAVAGAAIRWREHVEGDVEVRARFDDGLPALVAHGRLLYLACWPDAALLAAMMRHFLAEVARLPLEELPDAVRLRRRGDLVFAFNYGTERWSVPAGADLVLGAREVEPQDLACWRDRGVQ